MGLIRDEFKLSDLEPYIIRFVNVLCLSREGLIPDVFGQEERVNFNLDILKLTFLCFSFSFLFWDEDLSRCLIFAQDLGFYNNHSKFITKWKKKSHSK